MDDKKTAKLVDWNIVRGDRLVASIYDDESGRFKDGTHVLTSEIIRVDFANHIVETRNTIYTLGEKYSNIYGDIRALKLLRALSDVEDYCGSCDCTNKDKKAILGFIEWKYRINKKNEG